MADTIDIVKQSIAELCKCNAKELMPETKLAQELKMRSVIRIELAAVLEERCGVKITTFDILKPKTVQDIVTMIEKKKD
jgi:acyl carrier protein